MSSWSNCIKREERKECVTEQSFHSEKLDGATFMCHTQEDFCFCKSHILERRRRKKWNERKTDELTDSGGSKCTSTFVLCGPF